MDNGLYISAMGMQVQEYRQSVLANNLANAQTVGFKRAIATFQARPNAAYENASLMQFRNDPIYGKMNGGVWAMPTMLDLSQGTLVESGSKTDVALEGKGFFTIRGENGEKLLTRNGKFAVTSEGNLVTSTGGLKVLDAGGSEIRVNRNLPVDIDLMGGVSQGGQVITSLGLVDITNPQAIEPIGNNAFRLRDPNAASPSESTTVRQGYVEQSSVDPLTEMVTMLEGQRTFEANARMISMQDQMLAQLNQVGRVA